jgi:Transglycosylase SLT domain
MRSVLYVLVGWLAWLPAWADPAAPVTTAPATTSLGTASAAANRAATTTTVPGWFAKAPLGKIAHAATSGGATGSAAAYGRPDRAAASWFATPAYAAIPQAAATTVATAPGANRPVTTAPATTAPTRATPAMATQAAAASAAGQPGLLCRQAIEAAGRTHGVPAGLMAAIGRVESGRRDPVSMALHPWPWTVDAEGQGTFYDTKDEAIAAVRALQARGMRSIDVGCMQVNLMQHPAAFSSLAEAFDPAANADYAGRFLVELHGQSGTWPAAVALYHSATPDVGEAYRQKVMAVWPEEQFLAEAAPRVALAQAWRATLGPAGLFPPPPRRDAGVRVIPQMAAGSGGAPVGRGLDAYRAAPIGPGWRRFGG